MFWSTKTITIDVSTNTTVDTFSDFCQIFEKIRLKTRKCSLIVTVFRTFLYITLLKFCLRFCVINVGNFELF